VLKEHAFNNFFSNKETFYLLPAFSTAASIAFFHGAEYLERNKISQVDPYMGKFYLSWDAVSILYKDS
jgi:hypothetical protein